MRYLLEDAVADAGSLQVERIDDVVREIRRVEREIGWKRVLAIDGLLVRLRESDGGDTPCSLRRLAGHPGCPLSKSQLREIVEAARVYKEEATVRDARHVSPSHAAVVASLPVAQRRTLLRSAEARKLGVRELRELAKQSRRELGERRGRPIGSPAAKAVTRYDNAVIQLEAALELASAGRVEPEVQERMEALLARIRELYLEGVERFARSDGMSAPARALRALERDAS